MADKDIISVITTAIENRVEALSAEAERLLQAGEADYSKFKTAMAAELKKLAAEIQAVLSNL